MNPCIKIIRELRQSPPTFPYEEGDATIIAAEKAWDLFGSIAETKLQHLFDTSDLELGDYLSPQDIKGGE